MKRKKFLIKIMCVGLAIVIAAVATVVTLNKPDIVAVVENSGFLSYSFKGNDDYKAYFSENGSFTITSPDGYDWGSGLDAKRVQKLSQNISWQEYMKSLIAVTYFDSSLSVYQSQTAYSASESVNVTAKMSDNGCKYNFVFSNLFISVKVEAEFKNGVLSVKIPLDGIAENGVYKVQSIEVLPFLGAEDHSCDGYIMYPDGAGALMEYGKIGYRPTNKKTETLKIYGFSGMEKSNKVYFPVFGIKNNANAVLAAVSTGAEECDINISPEGAVVDVNRAAFSMNYRYCYDVPESDISTAVSAGTSTKIDTQINNQDFEALYFFLSGVNADYSGMANIYREFLLENKFLNNSDTKKLLSLGLLMGENEQLNFTAKPVATTTFSEAQKILERLVERDINDITVSLIGWEKNGASANVRGFKPWNKLGGNNGLKNLLSTAQDNKISLLLQKNFYSIKKNDGGFSAKKDTVHEGNGFIHSNDFNDKFILNRLSSSKWFEEYSKKAKANSVGTSFVIFGENLTSDYSSKSRSSRVMTAKNIADILHSASQIGVVSVEGANLYCLKDTDMIFSIPNSSDSFSLCDKQIPFVQMVCFGSVGYTGEAINLYYNYETQLLKMLEYGYTPYFELTANGSSMLKYTDSNQLVSSKFSLWEDKLAEVYALSKAVSSLKNAYITHHSNDNGQVKVEYSNAQVMYLNYLDNEWNIDGRVIEPKSYCLVNSDGKVVTEGGKAE